MRTLVTVPLVILPVVGGVALLLVFGRNGLVRRWLDSSFGITLPFTTAGVVLLEAFVADAVPDPQRRGRAQRRGLPLRGGRGDPGRVPVYRVPPGDDRGWCRSDPLDPRALTSLEAAW